MARQLVVVLALGASLAQAQELQESEGPAIVLAARLAPEPGTSALPRRNESRDGGTKAASDPGEGTRDKFAVCPLPVAFLGDDDLSIRSYPAPSGAREGSGTNGWEQAPHVALAGRCGDLYIFQIKSRSRKPWTIERARLEGPDGEALPVSALRFKGKGDIWDTNVIVAEVPRGAKVPWLKLNLAGEDGRVAQLEARDLP